MLPLDAPQFHPTLGSQIFQPFKLLLKRFLHASQQLLEGRVCFELHEPSHTVNKCFLKDLNTAKLVTQVKVFQRSIRDCCHCRYQIPIQEILKGGLSEAAEGEVAVCDFGGVVQNRESVLNWKAVECADEAVVASSFLENPVSLEKRQG